MIAHGRRIEHPEKRFAEQRDRGEDEGTTDTAPRRESGRRDYFNLLRNRRLVFVLFARLTRGRGER